MAGFNRSKPFLYDQCDKFPNVIRAVQEHWLAPPYKKQHGVNKLRLLHPDFDGFGNSAMTKEVASKIRVGRPFGGTGFLYHKKFSSAIKPLVKYKHERVSVMSISSNIGNIIFLSCYLPYFNTSDLQNQKIVYQDTLSYIENVMNDHRGSLFVLGLDMNCNIFDDSHVYSLMLRDMMIRNNLISSFELVDNFDHVAEFTRCDVKTGSYTLIDGILISRSLANHTSNIQILDLGDNVSDHRPVEIDLSISLCVIPLESKRQISTVNWSKLTTDAISNYQSIMTAKLDDIDIPFYDLLHGDKLCLCNSHQKSIETYYQSIVDAVLYADSHLPRTNPNLHKPFWSDEISQLKVKSIDCSLRWRDSGSPKSGPIFECKKKCSKEYKQAIRKAKLDHRQSVNRDMHSHLLSHDSDSFWKLWRRKNREAGSTITRVEGEVTKNGIVSAFQTHFQQVYANGDTPSHESLRREFLDKFDSYFNLNINESIAPMFLSWSDMLDVLSQLKTGKASSGAIKPEHILHGSVKLALHLHLLFNSLIQHGTVISDFCKGTITPVIKDSEGDFSSCSNYRGITLGNLFSKLMEIAIDKKIEPFLHTDWLQFGFKKKTSTSHALFTLKKTVDFFTNRKTDVFVAFLDCSKAFDRISHYGLFIKLIERKIPLCILLILIAWHLSMTCRVKWDDVFSDEFAVPLGTKQGGISSPKFFSLYVDDLINVLRKSGVGCHIINLFVACVMFADDIALVSPSRSALQKLIHICESYCKKFCLNFNAKKSKIMVFGRSHHDSFSPVVIDSVPIECVSEWKYLGTTVKSGKCFSFSVRQDLSKFFRATNSVLSVLTGAHEHTLLSLLHSNCVPILTYACEVKQYSAADMSDCNVAINNVYRKIFGFKDWRSIRQLREVFNFPSIYVTFQKARDRFQRSCISHCNPIIRHLSLLEP